MNNFLQHINDREKFKETVKMHLDKAAFSKLDNIKKEMATEFLTTEDQ